MKSGNSISYHTIALIWLAILLTLPVSAAQDYVTTKAKRGEGITVLLNRFYLPVTGNNIALFKKINKNKFDKHGGLMKGYRYALPVKKIKFLQAGFAASLGLEDEEIISKIKEYNRKVEKANYKLNYKSDGIIWLPLYLTQKESENTREPSVRQKKKPSNIIEPLFGKKYAKVKIKNRKLDGYVFYLISGHGGPDPGAIGHKNNNELTEDEYGYDIILRLARNLMSNGAKVYIIVRDSTDGIRDNYYLKNNTAEYYYGGDTISHKQKVRLVKRAEIVNKLSKLYPQNKQYSVIIHVDSRHTKKRIDIFFYYQDGNKKSKAMAKTMYHTIKKKYEQKQPGRGYEGKVITRNLFMLRTLSIPTVYIELGNIQNPRDQKRILDPNNRQAIANWLRDGIINEVKK
jgi:N-acetylmuramoyl-L-alanine amidase